MSRESELQKRFGLQKLKLVAWVDKLNPQNEIKAYYENRSGAFVITEVNGVSTDDQFIPSVPKCYTYDPQRSSKWKHVSTIQCVKWSGVNLTFYKYTVKKHQYYSVCKRHGVSVDDGILNCISAKFGSPFIAPECLQVAAVQSVCYELIDSDRPELVKYEYKGPQFKPLFATLRSGLISPVTSDILERKPRSQIVEGDEREVIVSPYGRLWCYLGERYSGVGGILYTLNEEGLAERFYKVGAPECASEVEFDTFIQYKATCAGQMLRGLDKEVSKKAVREILSQFLHPYHWNRMENDIMRAAKFQRPALSREKLSGRGVLVVCCGIPGSGKSTFADAIEKELGFLRVNQDTLGSRGKCVTVATKALKDGRNVVLDRSNVDISQRNPWMSMAAKLNVETVVAVVITTPLETCIDRIWNREGHPTISHHSEKAAGIANNFAQQFFYPTLEEGFDKIILFEGQTAMELQELIFK